MSSECIIFLDNPDGVFYSGTNVSGRFELTTTEIQRIKGIVVRITGDANVCWENEANHKEDGRSVVKFIEYKNNENYLNYENYVLGSKYSTLFNLNPDTYTYTFNCDLPRNSPSSFTGRYGEIVYEVTVEIERGNIIYNNKFKQPFTVLYSLDLNSNSEYQLPKSAKGEVLYTCCSCFCGRGNLEVELLIPYNGYVSGQDIPYRMFVSNNTDSDLDTLSKVELMKKVTFESQTPEHDFKYREITLDTKYMGEVLRFTNKEFKNVLEIPTTPPTTPKTLSCCIRIEYFIKLFVITGWCADNIPLNIPITIGTNPITLSELNRNNVDIITMQPIAPRWEDTAVGSLRNLDLPPGYHTIAPPSYEESRRFTEDFELREKQIQRQKEFLPRYPVFFNNRGPAPPYDNSI